MCRTKYVELFMGRNDVDWDFMGSISWKFKCGDRGRALTAAKDAVALCITMLGVMSLWYGNSGSGAEGLAL